VQAVRSGTEQWFAWLRESWPAYLALLLAVLVATVLAPRLVARAVRAFRDSLTRPRVEVVPDPLAPSRWRWLRTWHARRVRAALGQDPVRVWGMDTGTVIGTTGLMAFCMALITWDGIRHGAWQWAASIDVVVVLVLVLVSYRPYVALLDDAILVQNPIRKETFTLASITSLERSRLGLGVRTIDGRRCTAWAIQSAPLAIVLKSRNRASRVIDGITYQARQRASTRRTRA
jgi:hypothetical protein